jgi:hypothetical protein
LTELVATRTELPTDDQLALKRFAKSEIGVRHVRPGFVMPEKKQNPVDPRGELDRNRAATSPDNRSSLSILWASG